MQHRKKSQFKCKFITIITQIRQILLIYSLPFLYKIYNTICYYFQILQYIIAFFCIFELQKLNQNNQHIFDKIKAIKIQIVHNNILEMSLGDHLLQQKEKIDDVYNPFENPPNIQKAIDHQKANKVGIDAEEDDENLRLCPCCENQIQKKQIPLNCNEQQLLFLGLGYPIFYKLSKYFAAIILIVFFISGSGFYFLVTLSCREKCVYFMQIPIINLEISGHDSAVLADFINVFTAIMILFLVIFIRIRLQRDIVSLQSKVVSPQQYTIIVQNLPEQISEDQLSDWSKENLGFKPIVINFAYNISQLSDAYEQRQFLSIRLNRLLIRQKQSVRDREDRQKTILTEEDIKDTKERISKYDNILDHYKLQNINCRKIGTAFLTYSEQKNVFDILNKYETNFINTILRRSLTSFRNKSVKFQGEPVVIRRAPAPGQIIWENLSFSFTRYVVTQCLAMGTMLIILVISFRIQLWFAAISYRFRQKMREDDDNEYQIVMLVQSGLIAFLIMIVNVILRFVIKFFINFKKHYSHSRYESSFCFYYSLMYILNTCLMIYIVHFRHKPTADGIPSDEQIPITERDHLLLYDIHFIMLVNAFSEPIYKIVDPYIWFNLLWKSHISTLNPDQNPYTQAYVNSIWQGPSVSNADNYQYIFRMLIVTTWFAHSAPLGVFLSLIAMFLDFWVNKYLLLRVCKKPENISKNIASPMIKSLNLIPLIYLCGVLQFTYKVSDSPNIFIFMLDFLNYGVTIIIILFTTWAYFYLKPPQEYHLSTARYDEVEMLFQSDYNAQNPMTKIRGQIKYAEYGALRKSTLRNDSKIIRELISVNKKSQQPSERQSQSAAKVKRKKLKKLQTIQMPHQLQLKNLNRYNSYRKRKSSSSSQLED